MITKLAQMGEDRDTLTRAIRALNFIEMVYPISVTEIATFTTTLATFGGLAVDRGVFRTLLPDARWFVYAAGFVKSGDTNTATVSLVYQKDDLGLVTLGSVSATGTLSVKRAMGPFSVFETVGVPPGEQIPVVRLAAQKSAGVNGTLTTWCIWLRLVPAKQ